MSSAGYREGRRAQRSKAVKRLVGRRLVALAVLLVLLSMGVFWLADASPFDPLVGYLGDRYQFTSQAQKEALTQTLGFGKNWWTAWGLWAGDVAQGQWGFSRIYNQPVAHVVAERLPATLILSGTGLTVAAVLGLGLGLLSVLKPKSRWGVLIEKCAVVIQAMPPFVLSLGVIMVFSIGLGWFPTGGAAPVTGEVTWAARLHHLTLPALVLGLSQTPWLLLTVREAALKAMVSDPVKAARTRGLPLKVIMTGHVLPVSLAPMLTVLGVRLSELIVGAVLIEDVFSWPGLAAAMVKSAKALDLPMLAFMATSSAAVVIIGSLLADLAYMRLDSRVEVDA